MHTLRVLQKLDDLFRLFDQSENLDTGAANNLIDGLTIQKVGRYRKQIIDHINQRLNPERKIQALILLAAAYHDVGKPQVQEMDPTGRIRFFGHDEVGAEIAAKRARALRLSNPEIKRLELVVRHHMRPLLLTNSGRLPSRRAIYRFFRDTQEAGVDICILSLADFLGTYPVNPPQERWLAHLETIRALLAGWWEHEQVTVNPAPLLDGRDLIKLFGLSPGPMIGQILEQLREAQAIGLVSSPDQAREWAAELLQKKKNPGEN
jgi:putative nucleotidyltransferase with HDIG domain